MCNHLLRMLTLCPLVRSGLALVISQDITYEAIKGMFKAPCLKDSHFKNKLAVNIKKISQRQSFRQTHAAISLIS